MIATAGPGSEIAQQGRTAPLTKVAVPKVITGQRINAAKQQAAQEMRDQMTPAEQRLWQRLRANRLGGFHFRRQQVIDGFIVDFYCHAAGLVVELDGGVHRDRVEYDAERDLLLAQHGLTILRFSNERIADGLDAVLAEIEQVCQQRTAGVENLSPICIKIRNCMSIGIGQEITLRVSSE